MTRADYGYDAPYGLLLFAGLALLAAVFAAVFWLQGENPAVMGGYALFFAANAASFWYTTRRGKLVEWARVLDAIRLRGDEQLLDLGCGRGAVLIAAAKRLENGRATGVDIWNRLDQSGNAREVTLRNAALEGVDGRVQVETGDMRALPFADASFDVVLSSLAIHNIRGNHGRRLAVAEALRVLKPGGRLAIADIRATRVYADELRARGAVDVRRRRLGWRFWWGNPIAATRLLTASKPE
jgi:SAM-dependent methyltransferase